MAALVLSVLPIAIQFISIQQYFTKGITVGVVKMRGEIGRWLLY